MVLGVSILFSLWRGFVREALSLAGWVAAFVVANTVCRSACAELAGIIANMTGRYMAAYAMLFVATLMVFTPGGEGGTGW